MTVIQAKLSQLKATAAAGKRVAHATRILLAPGQTDEACGGSGEDPASGWEAWLGPHSPVLEPHEYFRAGRWQQGCYFGDADALAEYTAVAAELAVRMPPDFASPAADWRDLPRGRDAWTFATYRVGGG